MKKLLMSLIIALVLSITIGFHPATAIAEEAEYQISSYLSRVEFMPISDVDKHGVGIYERRGFAIFKDGRRAAYHSMGTWDFIDSNGPFNGYQILTYEDGSTTIAKYEGKMIKTAGAKLQRMEGKGEYIKGTGKYEGIKGTMSFTGDYITPYGKETKGDALVHAKSSYTIAK